MFFGDDKRIVTAAIDKKTAFNFRRIDVEVQQDSGDAALDFIVRVFKVPIPDAQLLWHRHAKQRPTGRHCDQFHKIKARLADARRGDCRGYEFADVVLTVKPLAGRNSLRIAPDEKSRGNQRQGRIVAAIRLPRCSKASASRLVFLRTQQRSTMSQT